MLKRLQALLIGGAVLVSGCAQGHGASVIPSSLGGMRAPQWTNSSANLFADAAFTGTPVAAVSGGPGSTGVTAECWQGWAYTGPASTTGATFSLDTKASGVPGAVAEKIVSTRKGEYEVDNFASCLPVITSASTYVISFYGKASLPNTVFYGDLPPAIGGLYSTRLPASNPDTNWHRYAFRLTYPCVCLLYARIGAAMSAETIWIAAPQVQLGPGLHAWAP